MTLKNKVIVRIYGQEHTLRSDDTREYMQRVANLVDDKMKEIGSINKKLSTSQLAVLTALNLTDEYLKVLDMFEDLKSKLDNPDFEVKRLQDNLNISQGKLAEKTEEVDRIMMDYNKLLQNSSEYENQIGKLRLQNDDFNFEINQKNSKLSQIENTCKEKDTLINRINMEKDSLKRKLKIYEGKTSDYDNKLEEKILELSIMMEEIASKDVEIFDLKEELDELRSSTKFSNEHILALKKEIDIKDDEIKDVWDKYEITKKELNEFIETFDS
ncbi:MAG: cell division protein ZapA [Acidaminobacteraceae bacterium]|jgi:cell division protein ZapA